MNDKNESMTFESALARLEVIVKSLDAGNVPLDQSLDLFEEGVTLVKFCNQKLETVERKIKILANGEETDFLNEK